MSPAPRSVDDRRMDDIIDTLGGLIREISEDNMDDRTSTWACAACGQVFIGNAVKPTMTHVSEKGVHPFCATCAPGVVRVGDVIEQVGIDKLVGTKAVKWPPPEAGTQQCPECGEGGQTCVMHVEQRHLALYQCAAGHEWEVDLRETEQ